MGKAILNTEDLLAEVERAWAVEAAAVELLDALEDMIDDFRGQWVFDAYHHTKIVISGEGTAQD